MNNKIIEDLEGRTAYEYLRNIMDKYKSPKLTGLPPFTGGLVGYFSYEMISYFEPSLEFKNSQSNEFDLMLLIR